MAKERSKVPEQLKNLKALQLLRKRVQLAVRDSRLHEFAFATADSLVLELVQKNFGLGYLGAGRADLSLLHSKLNEQRVLLLYSLSLLAHWVLLQILVLREVRFQ